jgi:hypothetical protein
VHLRQLFLHAFVSKEEKLRIQKNAKAADRSVSAFIKEMSLDMCIIESGPDKIISNHIAEISALRNGIFQLVFTRNTKKSFGINAEANTPL